MKKETIIPVEICTLGEAKEEWDALPIEEKLDCILSIANDYDKWVDHFTDRVLENLPCTARENAWMENLMFSHKEIFDMVVKVFQR